MGVTDIIPIQTSILLSGYGDSPETPNNEKLLEMHDTEPLQLYVHARCKSLHGNSHMYHLFYVSLLNFHAHENILNS